MSKITPTDLGLGATKAFSKILVGVVSGFIVISLVALMINLLGGVTTEYHFKPEYLSTLALGLVFFAFQGTSEELIYRSYLMPHFSKKMGIVRSILLTSVLFTLIHALNLGMTVMQVVNWMLASVVFSLVYGHYGQHIEQSVLKAVPAENMTLISGGYFGFDGSIVTSIMGVILIALLMVKIRRNKTN